jgi:hypothetical protein
MNIDVVHDEVTYHCSFPPRGLIEIVFIKKTSSGVPMFNTIDISVLAVKKSLVNWIHLPIPVPVKEEIERVVRLWAFR